MLWAVFFYAMLFSFLFSNACIKCGSLCMFLCPGSLFSRGEFLLSTSRTCVFPCAVCKCLLSFPIEGLGVALVVKGMWGDKCQVFESPQASNPGGRMLGRHRAPLSFLMWPHVWSQSFPPSTGPETAERRKCGVGDDMKGKQAGVSAWEPCFKHTGCGHRLSDLSPEKVWLRLTSSTAH